MESERLLNDASHCCCGQCLKPGGKRQCVTFFIPFSVIRSSSASPPFLWVFGENSFIWKKSLSIHTKLAHLKLKMQNSILPLQPDQMVAPNLDALLYNALWSCLDHSVCLLGAHIDYTELCTLRAGIQKTNKFSHWYTGHNRARDFWLPVFCNAQ